MTCYVILSVSEGSSQSRWRKDSSVAALPQNDMGGRANEKDSSSLRFLRMTGEGAASAQKYTSVSVKRQRCFLKKLCGTTLVPGKQGSYG